MQRAVKALDCLNRIGVQHGTAWWEWNARALAIGFLRSSSVCASVLWCQKPKVSLWKYVSDECRTVVHAHAHLGLVKDSKPWRCIGMSIISQYKTEADVRKGSFWESGQSMHLAWWVCMYGMQDGARLEESIINVKAMLCEAKNVDSMIQVW